MGEQLSRDAADYIWNDLRLRTFPVAVRFPREGEAFPEKTRRPSVTLGKRVSLCQGVTMARNYGWTLGMTKEDNICVPAAIAFGFSDSGDQAESISGLFCEIGFSPNEQSARRETGSMMRFDRGEISSILLAPLQKAAFDPDIALFYGNPAQMMRFAQAYSYVTGERVEGHFGGKVECDEYLIAPFKDRSARMVIPGNGERIFAGTQDDEMVFAMPAAGLPDLARGLKEAGKAMGARYPVTPYLNYQPEFPKAHRELGRKLGVL